jgi:uncharacterized protein (TIGR02145 family)
MKKINFLVMLLLVATVSAQAQVTIGSKKIPSPFSILELISGSESNNGNRGLRLPQLTTVEREAMEETDDFQNKKTTTAVGLQIFNTTTRCVETWNGTKWIQKCGEDGPRPLTGQVAISITGSKITYRDFMAYNLGATEMSIKEQLMHVSPTTFFTFFETQVDAEDAGFPQVYGSLYQFGHQSDGHENVWSEKTTTTTGVPEDYLNTTTGQVDPDKDIAQDYYGKFIVGDLSISKYDWITENTSSLTGYAGNYYHMYPGRWDGGGNDVSYTPLTTPFPSSKVKVTNGNDPCPAGFRVPSKVEWESIVTPGNLTDGINKWVWVDGTQTLDQLGVESENNEVPKTKGYLIYPAAEASGGAASSHYETPTLFLPAAGSRDGSGLGGLSSGGSYGLYWSSTAYSLDFSNGYYLNFSNSAVSPANNHYRALGFSVRCVAD